MKRSDNTTKITFQLGKKYIFLVDLISIYIITTVAILLPGIVILFSVAFNLFCCTFSSSLEFIYTIDITGSIKA